MSLLPPNSTKLEYDLEASISRTLPFYVPDVWNPQQCPVALLPWLAWALSVENWNAITSEVAQRAALAESIKTHSIMGTPASMRRALALLGFSAVVIDEFAAYFANGAYTANGSITASGDSLAYTYDLTVPTGAPTYQYADGSITADGTTRANGYTAAYSKIILSIQQIIAETANVRSHLRHLRYALALADGTHIANGSLLADGGLIHA